MKIVFVSREFPPSKRTGGIATYVWESAKWLSENGHQVTVIAASDDVSKELQYTVDGINVIRLSGGDFFIGKRRSLLNAIYSYFRSIWYFKSYRLNINNHLQRMAAEKLIDIVEFPEYGNEAYIWAMGKKTIPWIIRLHGPTLLDRKTGNIFSKYKSPVNWIFGKKEIATIEKADFVTSPSIAMADKILEFSDIICKKINIIPNSINITEWSFLKNKLLEKNKFEKIIFFAGSIVHSKGCLDLVEAVRLLRQKGINIKLILAGKHGSLGRTLIKKKEYCWLSLPGQISRDDLASYFLNADLVVFPSWWEPFGIVVIEAMATQALVLGSTAGGMQEIIDDGINGFLIPPKDPLLLANKIKYIFDLPFDIKNKIKLEAVSKVKANFEVGLLMRKQILFYELIKNKIL